MAGSVTPTVWEGAELAANLTPNQHSVAIGAAKDCAHPAAERISGHVELVFTAVYVIDKAGKVAWAKVESNYRQRPSNQEIRAAIEALR